MVLGLPAPGAAGLIHKLNAMPGGHVFGQRVSSGRALEPGAGQNLTEAPGKSSQGRRDRAPSVQQPEEAEQGEGVEGHGVAVHAGPEAEGLDLAEPVTGTREAVEWGYGLAALCDPEGRRTLRENATGNASRSAPCTQGWVLCSCVP